MVGTWAQMKMRAEQSRPMILKVQPIKRLEIEFRLGPNGSVLARVLEFIGGR